MTFVETIHGKHVAGRRARVLSEHLADLVPPGATVLDVGCGDGEIAWRLHQQRPDLTLTGVDVLVREETKVPVHKFDGRRLPFADHEFDVVTFVDVLHHCDWPLELLREACRVARHSIIIKDHTLQGLAGGWTLRFMDWVGNRRYGVRLPYNYWRPNQWQSAFGTLGLEIQCSREKLGLYAWPLSLLFERRLHFVARLARPQWAAGADARPGDELVRSEL